MLKRFGLMIYPRDTGGLIATETIELHHCPTSEDFVQVGDLFYKVHHTVVTATSVTIVVSAEVEFDLPARFEEDFNVRWIYFESSGYIDKKTNVKFVQCPKPHDVVDVDGRYFLVQRSVHTSRGTVVLLKNHFVDRIGAPV